MSSMISIELINAELRPASEVREAMDVEAIDTYHERLDEMPPIKVFVDGHGIYWLSDGAHTVTAARKAGRTEVRAEVRDGSYLDAFHVASRANDSHGVRVTNADKHHRVRVALASPETKGWSLGRIAELCGVAQSFVSKVGATRDESPVVGKDGRTYKAKPRTQSNGTTHLKDESRGKCLRNGVLVDDPPDVAADRAAGLIPPDQIVEITEPDEETSLESVKEDIAERRAIQDDISDEDWLARFPLYHQLKGVQLATFKDEALVYRRAIGAVKQCGKKVAEEFNKVRRRGGLHWRWTFGFRVDSPDKWVRCAEPSEGGCGGAGSIQWGDQTRPCGQCRGDGYRVNA